MRGAKWFRELVSGEKRGAMAAVLRGVLGAAEGVYSVGIRYRNRAYDRRDGAVQRVPVPVVSVGNLTTGGTGKTPLVAWIARWFRQRDLRVALVSRGYGGVEGLRNDEARELELQLPHVPHLQNVNRVTAAAAAIAEHASQVIVLDDAFQHRRIHRDLDLVLIDALEPFGYGHLLPRGLLREPLSSLSRAHVVVLSRADLISEAQRTALREKIFSWSPNALWMEVAHRPRRLIDVDGDGGDVHELRGARVAAFCGLGNPLGFRRTLEAVGAEVVAFHEFPDHHAYSSRDLRQLAEELDSCDVQCVLCTMKDFVKLRAPRVGRHALRALSIEIEVLVGREELESRLSALLPREIRS